MEKLIGIIGGMGPAASELFYKMVTEHTAAECDQDHVNMLILSDTSMPDRTAAILSGEYEAVYERLLSDARLLSSAGCKAIGITCNTAHFFADMIADKLDIPIIHMLRETVKEIVQNQEVSNKEASKKEKLLVGIMATEGTIQTGLYQKILSEYGLTAYVPSEKIQKELMYQIYERIKKGLPCDKESWARIVKEYDEAGCDSLILGCTELSVISSELGLPERFIDPMLVLAKRVIEFTGHSFI